MTIDYSTVTEIAGDEISHEQLNRLCHRYYWAGNYIKDKDVIEAACGTGPGLGYLNRLAKSLKAGDYDENILGVAQTYYGERIDLRQFDAQDMPYEEDSKDAIILFEAIYYLPSAEKFVDECRRLLRPGGQVLIATANKDLYDFNPSPYTHTYYGVVELNNLFSTFGFSLECFGYLSVRDVSLRQKLLRPIKKLAVELDLIPKTAHGKKWIKRIMFRDMVTMPAEIIKGMILYDPPTTLPLSAPDREHKVIYCAATLNS